MHERLLQFHAIEMRAGRHAEGQAKRMISDDVTRSSRAPALGGLDPPCRRDSGGGARYRSLANEK